MRYVLGVLATVGLVIAAGQAHVQAAELTYEFKGSFNGPGSPLLNKTFQGTFSYDTAGSGFFRQATSTLTIGNTTLTQSATLGPAPAAPGTLELVSTNNGGLPSWTLSLKFSSLPPLNAPLPLNTLVSAMFSYTDKKRPSKPSVSGNVVVTLAPDLDGDGIPDVFDECPNSDLKPTVVIGSCNSGVTNTRFPSGCTLADLIAEHSDNGEHGVTRITNRLKRIGIISDRQKEAIQGCACEDDHSSSGDNHS